MLAAKRRQFILQRLHENGDVANGQLAAEFGVSVDTIRRDMRLLAREGLVHRTHGGATWVDDWEITAGLGRDPLLPIKRAIAAKALKFVRPGETIALDIGSTTSQFARALATASPVTPLMVITNDFRIASFLTKAKGITVNLTGGTIGQKSFLWGPLTKRTLEILYFDTVFMGTSGLTVKEGLTDPIPEAAEVKQALITNAKRVILLTDHTKFGRRHMMRVAEIDRIDAIVTDEWAPADMLAELRKRGIYTVTVSIEHKQAET